MSEDRKVATDALATLGFVIDETAKRDAIHLAVFPAVAGQTLFAGQHVRIESDGRARVVADGEGIGIADPFLRVRVQADQRFWLVLYPRQISSLRHVWSHPAFTDEPETSVRSIPATNAKAESEAWLRAFVARGDGPSYEKLLESAVNGRYNEHSEYLHIDGEDAYGDIPDEMWSHLETVTGVKIEHRAKYFSCAC